VASVNSNCAVLKADAAGLISDAKAKLEGVLTPKEVAHLESLFVHITSTPAPVATFPSAPDPSDTSPVPPPVPKGPPRPYATINRPVTTSPGQEAPAAPPPVAKTEEPVPATPPVSEDAPSAPAVPPVAETPPPAIADAPAQADGPTFNGEPPNDENNS
jgi:hypothetical protein